VELIDDPNLRFRNAPLVELTVELQWKHTHPERELTDEPAKEADQGYFAPAVGGDEFDKFSRIVAAAGFNLSERLFPTGYPPPIGRPLFKYESVDREVATVFMQLGLGYLSVTAFPPYRSWAEYRPYVVLALEALLETRTEAERALPFTTLSLRYINAYREALVAPSSLAEFVRDALGFKIEIPPVLSTAIGAEAAQFFVTGSVTTRDFKIDIAAGESSINGDPAAILDLILTARNDVLPVADEVLGVLDAAHRLNRGVFLEVSKSVIDRLDQEK